MTIDSAREELSGALLQGSLRSKLESNAMFS